MANLDRFIDHQAEVIKIAIEKYYESPTVVRMAVAFADEQGHLLQHYSPRERIFTLTDGEPYTADYIIKHMTKKQQP